MKTLKQKKLILIPFGIGMGTFFITSAAYTVLASILVQSAGFVAP